ncbi:MAG: globin domain-containing protein [Pseudomonadota bacterium]
MNDNAGRIRLTWAAASGDATRLASLFYANLFRIDETTRPLFVGDLALQGRKLADTLNFIVDHLEEEHILLPAARDLAIRHLNYGVTADQYQAVGQALLETLRQILGPTFSSDDARAWLETYAGLSKAMIAAAYPSSARPE